MFKVIFLSKINFVFKKKNVCYLFLEFYSMQFFTFISSNLAFFSMDSDIYVLLKKGHLILKLYI